VNVDPVDRATVGLLQLLNTQWSEYAALAVTEPHERALNRLINAGLVEAGGVVTFMQPGSPTRLVVEGRWSGRVTEAQTVALLAVVSEWFESGVAMNPTTVRVRLTSVGLTAQDDIRSRDNQHIVLTLLRGGASEEGGLHVESQRIERPLPPDAQAGRI